MDDNTKIYNKKKSKKITHEQSLNEKNKTVHNYTIETNTMRHIHIAESTIRRIHLIIGFILGTLIHYIYTSYTAPINNYIIKIKNSIYFCTPFARKIVQENTFNYIFRVGTILTVIIVLICFLILIDEKKLNILSFLLLAIFCFVYLYFNFGICHLLIKIPKFFKIISTILIIIINIIVGFICIGLEFSIIEG